MEDSDDFDYSRLNRAIVEHMNWFFHFRLRSIDARMTQMKTAEPGRELISRLGERVFGIGCDCSDRLQQGGGRSGVDHRFPIAQRRWPEGSQDRSVQVARYENAPL